ncbi:MAG: type II toxin-antitoxin system VapC family toxin [Pseudomonadota bacterium]
MIVDTSALMATLIEEDGFAEIVAALRREVARIPTPVLAEFFVVAAGRSEIHANKARLLIEMFLANGGRMVTFSLEHARAIPEARDLYGKGNGRGGKLNLLDLMVYAVAKVEDEPLLCTGRDFAATDMILHPASRTF